MCLDECYLRAKSLSFNHEKCPILEEKMVKDKYLSCLCLQYSALLSRQGKHLKALEKAKLAYKHAINLVNTTAVAAKKQLAKFRDIKKPNLKVSMIRRAFPALAGISLFIDQGVIPQVTEIRSSAGVLGHPE